MKEVSCYGNLVDDDNEKFKVSGQYECIIMVWFDYGGCMCERE